MPEEEIAREGEAGQHRGAGEAGRRPRRRAVLEAHPGVEHRQGQGDAPEGAREGADVRRREAHEDRRDAHCDGAGAQGREGRGEARLGAQGRLGAGHQEALSVG